MSENNSPNSANSPNSPNHNINSNNNNNTINTSATNIINNHDISNTIINYTLNEILNDSITITTNQQGTDISSIQITNTFFDTIVTNDIDVNIIENLTSSVEVYDDTSSNALLNEIKLYASEIKCSDFHGKGTINDYNQLFITASKIANETKQITLDVDTNGFNEFANAADDLSALFNSFIVKLQNINIINDLDFLSSVANALKKIVNLSNTFGRFKQTIIATSQIQVPKSALDANSILSSVNDEISCAMNYISYFVDPTSVSPSIASNAALSSDEQHVITKAIDAIENWQTLSEHGLTISMNNDPNIIGIKQSNTNFLNKTSNLKNLTLQLKLKMDQYKNI
jgi:hypothetical protein